MAISRIDAFNKRLEKTRKMNESEAVKVTEEVPATLETVAKNDMFLREKSLLSSVGGIAGKSFLEGPTAKENDGFIFDILSNAVSFGEEAQMASDFIFYEDELFAVNPHGIVDAATDIVVNVRTSYIKNDLVMAPSLVDKTLSDVAGGGNRFYILPDNTDFFTQNIKSAFGGGYHFIWRSILAAYEKNSDDQNPKIIKVIDLFENEPALVEIKAEPSKRYGAVMFTRCNKIPKAGLKPLSYYETAKAFWRSYGYSMGIPLDADRLALTKDTFELLCNGKSLTLLYSGKLYIIKPKTARTFLDDYFGKCNDLLPKLGGCVVFADHLENARVKDNFKYIKSGDIGRYITEFKRRLKNGIPLWQETLPKLVLERIAVNGRLSKCILVENGKTIPNVFGAYPIPCAEKLTLPVGHKDIKFPLSIRGINNKKYIAKVHLEEALTSTAAFDVMLKYNFNNENSYDFELSREEKKVELVIEEGTPEKRNLPFKMQISSDNENAILADIYMELNSILNKMKMRKKEELIRPYCYEEGLRKLKETPWEKEVRRKCSNIASAVLGLSYSTREKKHFPDFEGIVDEIDQLIFDAYRDGDDDMDKCYFGLVHATIALFSDEDVFDDGFYGFFQKNLGKIKSSLPDKLKNSLEYKVQSIVLCNPKFDKKTIDGILDMCEGEIIIRTFSLPLIANDALLNYICLNRSNWLNQAVIALKGYFYDISIAVKRSDKNSLKYNMYKVRDGYEFLLGLCKLRNTEYWNSVKGIEGLLGYAVKIEQRIYNILSSGSTQKAAQFVDLYKAQDWRGNKELMLSRITFEGNENFKNLNLMNPLALTAITYLEGNPDIHIVGRNLKDDD